MVNGVPSASLPTPPGRKHQAWLIGLGVLVSGLFVYLMFRKVDLTELATHVSQVDPHILALALVVDLVAFLVLALRSHVLLRPLHPYPFWTVLKSILLAYAGNYVFPARAGEVMRLGFLVHKGGASTSSCLAVVAAERILDAGFILALSLVGISLSVVEAPTGITLYVLAGILAACIVLAFLAGRFPGAVKRAVHRVGRLFGRAVSASFIDRSFDGFSRGLQGLSSIRHLLLILLATGCNWGLTAVSIHIWLIAFGLSLPWYASLVILGFVAFGLAVPSSPGNVGTFHYFVTHALVPFGVPLVLAASVAVVGHAVKMPFVFVGVVLCFPDVFGRNRHHAPSEAHAPSKPSAARLHSKLQL